MNMIEKLENKERVDELNPLETLKSIGLHDGSIFCDIGAGTGIFSFAAAKITQADIYAVDTSERMRDFIIARNEQHRAPIIVKKDISFVPSDSCDFAMLCTVLHEIDDIDAMLGEIRRVLKAEGILTVIEFHKYETPFGPPVVKRISEKEVEKMLEKSGFKKKDSTKLGDNFYILNMTRG